MFSQTEIRHHNKTAKMNFPLNVRFDLEARCLRNGRVSPMIILFIGVIVILPAYSQILLSSDPSENSLRRQHDYTKDEVSVRYLPGVGLYIAFLLESPS